MTPRQLRDHIRRAAVEADPDGTARRAETAKAERHVWIDPAPDQMAWLTAHLPADDAARIWARLDTVARHNVRRPDEARTLGRLRADALTQLVTTGFEPLDGADTCDAPVKGDARTSDGGRRAPYVEPTPRPMSRVSAVVNVTVSASTLLGLDESPAQLAGYGPVPAAVARALAADGDATWRRILTDPATGAASDVSRTAYRPGTVLGDLVRTREPVCTFPGCCVPAARCDLDHIEPFDPTRSTAGQTRASNLHPVCRAHHNAKTHGGWSTHADDDGAITWAAPSRHEYRVPPTPSDPSRSSGATSSLRPRPGRAGPHRSAAPPTPPPPDPLDAPPF